MNKLVSKNPILRFKLGNRIEKFLTPSRGITISKSEVSRFGPTATRILLGWKNSLFPTIPKNDNTIYMSTPSPRRRNTQSSNSIQVSTGTNVPKTTENNVNTSVKKAATPKTTNYSGAIWNYLNSKANLFGGWQTNPNGNRYFTITNDDGSKVNVFGDGQMYTQDGKLAGSITELDIINTNLRKRTALPNLNSNNRSNRLSFKTAFNNARNAGQETFNWRGLTYNTRNKGEENYVFQNGKWINPISNITFLVPQDTINEPVKIPLTASITSPNAIIPNTITAPQITYDRTGIRQLIRDRGFNPYLFSGAQRRALRMVLNGQGTDTDRAIVSGTGIFKKGGLISRNPINRFKSNR